MLSFQHSRTSLLTPFPPVLSIPTEIGFIVGKNGTAIKALMEETGALVRVMPKAELPTCAWVSDELIKVSGPHHAIAAALRVLAKQLEQHPPRNHHHAAQRPPLLLAHASTGDAQFMTPPSPALLSGYHHHHAMSPGGMMQPSGLVETVFRLLAPAARAGNIIGRNGDHVRKIRAETGARIKVYGAEEDAEERLVCVYSTEDALSQYCAAQDALVRCAISLTADDTSNGQHRMRLVAPQTSIGAVMGKKGQTMMQLRQEAGAAIRVQPMEAPIAASAATAHGGGEPGGDEIIQIDGTLQQCVSALRGVATLLRGWQIRRCVSNSPRPMTAVALSPALLVNQPIGLSSVHGSLVAFPVAHHHHNGGTHTGSSSPAAFAALSSAMHSLGVGSAGPVLWRYRLSNAQAGAVIGKGGHHVTQIRSMTGARIHLPGDQVPDGTRVLEISGAIESCQAAHAMVNQFLALGQCLPAVPEHQSGASVLSFATPSTSSMGSPAGMASPRSLHQYQPVAAGTDMSTYA
jgi:transcription antitermination factor NusA-like protein